MKKKHTTGGKVKAQQKNQPQVYLRHRRRHLRRRQGIAASSIGKILQARGFSVTALKIDPYVNVDAGTMNPTEHGEVFVLQDGDETDQDMGNYERF